MPSTPFHPILRSQRGEKRPDARRAGAGIATPISSSRNNAGGRFSPRPQGAPQTRQCGVTALGNSVSYCAAGCALPWRVWRALIVKNRVKRGTRRFLLLTVVLVAVVTSACQTMDQGQAHANAEATRLCPSKEEALENRDLRGRTECYFRVRASNGIRDHPTVKAKALAFADSADKGEITYAQAEAAYRQFRQEFQDERRRIAAERTEQVSERAVSTADSAGWRTNIAKWQQGFSPQPVNVHRSGSANANVLGSVWGR